MGLSNTILIYLLCGVGFSASFEYLMHKTKYPKVNATKNWERVFWVTCWPYCIVKFLTGILK